MKDLFRFEILHKNIQDGDASISYLQSWPMLNIGQTSGTYVVMMESGLFSYVPSLPTYQENYSASSSAHPYSLYKKNLGVLVRDHITGFLKIELRDNFYSK